MFPCLFSDPVRWRGWVTKAWWKCNSSADPTIWSGRQGRPKCAFEGARVRADLIPHARILWRLHQAAVGTVQTTACHGVQEYVDSYVTRDSKHEQTYIFCLRMFSLFFLQDVGPSFIRSTSLPAKVTQWRPAKSTTTPRRPRTCFSWPWPSRINSSGWRDCWREFKSRDTRLPGAPATSPCQDLERGFPRRNPCDPTISLSRSCRQWLNKSRPRFPGIRRRHRPPPRSEVEGRQEIREGGKVSNCCCVPFREKK